MKLIWNLVCALIFAGINPTFSAKIGESCGWHGDCPGGDLGESVCSTICICATGYIQKNDNSRCLPIRQQSGEACEEPQQCIAGVLGSLSDCFEKDGDDQKKCDCKPDAIQEKPAEKCWQQAVKLNDTCEVQAQCLVNLGLSLCSDTKICVCMDSAVSNFQGTKCILKRYLGETCEENGECTHLFPPYPADCFRLDPLDPDKGSECRCVPGWMNPAGSKDQCFKLADRIGETCSDDPIQCDNLTNSRCDDTNDKTCQCPSTTHVANTAGTICLDLKPNLGDLCQENQQCQKDHSVCELGFCSCASEGYTESSVTGECVKIIDELDGETCSEDTQCEVGVPGKNSECDSSSKTCKCKTGFVSGEIEPLQHCYKPITKAYDDMCESTAHCQHYLGDLSNCVYNTPPGQTQCLCLEGALPTTNSSWCLPGPLLIEESCEDHAQCVDYNEGYSTCDAVERKCKCKSDFVASGSRHKCLPVVDSFNGECEETQQCTNGSLGELSTCEAIDSPLPVKRCICSSVGVYISTLKKCLRKAVFVNDPCEEDEQCSANLSDNSFCDNGGSNTCECKPTANPSADGRQCVLKRYISDSCFDQGECSHIPYSTSCQYSDPSKPELGGICGCNVGYSNPKITPKEEDICVEMMKRINDPCREHPFQCSTIPNANCNAYLCQCDPSNFVPSSDMKECLPLLPNLGELCKENAQCSVEHASCRDDPKKCLCDSGYIGSTVVSPGKLCLKVAENLGESCQEKDQCTTKLGDHSDCALGQCKCAFGYIPSIDGKTCLLPGILIGDPCPDPPGLRRCAGAVGTSHCHENVCQCIPRYVPSMSREECLEIQDSLDGHCWEKAQCTEGTPGIWSDCLGNKCVCRIDAIDVANHCYRKALSLGDDCVVAAQCVNLENSMCLPPPQSICDCDLTTHYRNPERTKCLQKDKWIGEKCQAEGQCIPQGSECTASGDCVCKTGYVSSENRQNCLEIRNTVNSTCTDSLQCTAGNLGLRSFCDGGLCQCLAAHGAHNNTCYPKVRLNEVCICLEECLVGVGKLAICSNGRCSCYGNTTEYAGNCYEFKRVGDKCEENPECLASISGDVYCDTKSATCKCKLGTSSSLFGARCKGFKFQSQQLTIILCLIFLFSFLNYN